MVTSFETVIERVSMRAQPLAGKPGPRSILVNVPRLVTSYKLTRAPGKDHPIGGLKVIAENGWFAARPSGTEDVYKIYSESFKGEEHLADILTEARQTLDDAFSQSGV